MEHPDDPHRAAVITPYLRLPFTDITACLITHQWHGRCQKQELNLMECMEAYGLDRGFQVCTKYLRDFRECHTRRMQTKRFFSMRAERNKQYRSGEREKHYADSPRMDSH